MLQRQKAIRVASPDLDLYHETHVDGGKRCEHRKIRDRQKVTRNPFSPFEVELKRVEFLVQNHERLLRGLRGVLVK